MRSARRGPIPHRARTSDIRPYHQIRGRLASLSPRFAATGRRSARRTAVDSQLRPRRERDHSLLGMCRVGLPTAIGFPGVGGRARSGSRRFILCSSTPRARLRRHGLRRKFSTGHDEQCGRWFVGSHPPRLARRKPSSRSPNLVMAGVPRIGRGRPRSLAGQTLSRREPSSPGAHAGMVGR